ncbi:hypothetical protein JXL21_02595 [Candidatus Bathyarchaeota archaeon]|nr:hypothetical protein [Candidatus Bathyarchaeota archaeon]
MRRSGGYDSPRSPLEAARHHFESSLRKAAANISFRVYVGEEPDLDALGESTLESFTRFRDAVGDGTSIEEEDIAEYLSYVVETKRRFHGALAEFCEGFDSEPKPMEPAMLYASPFWDTGLGVGVNLRAGGCLLYAAPRGPTATSHFHDSAGLPSSADLLYVGKDLMLFQPERQVPDAGFTSEFRDRYGEVETGFDEVLDEEVEVGPGFVVTETRRMLSVDALGGVLEGHGVYAVLWGRPWLHSALILTGLEGRLPKVVSEVFFRWHGYAGLF